MRHTASAQTIRERLDALLARPARHYATMTDMALMRAACAISRELERRGLAAAATHGTFPPIGQPELQGAHRPAREGGSSPDAPPSPVAHACAA